jgi:uncharacterized protein YodC (DUF2158 family)
MAKFKVGDVVQLNSGGLAMTVTDPDVSMPAGYEAKGVLVECVWFEGEIEGLETKQSERFHEDCLVPARRKG